MKRSVAKAPADRFRTIADALGEAAPGATATKGFGSGALKVNGKIYASLTRGRLLLKLPARRVDELVRLNIGDPFSSGPGRVKKEWLTVDVAHARRWRRLLIPYVTVGVFCVLRRCIEPIHAHTAPRLDWQRHHPSAPAEVCCVSQLFNVGWRCEPRRAVSISIGALVGASRRR